MEKVTGDAQCLLDGVHSKALLDFGLANWQNAEQKNQNGTSNNNPDSSIRYAAVGIDIHSCSYLF